MEQAWEAGGTECPPRAAVHGGCERHTREVPCRNASQRAAGRGGRRRGEPKTQARALAARPCSLDASPRGRSLRGRHGGAGGERRAVVERKRAARGCSCSDAARDRACGPPRARRARRASDLRGRAAAWRGCSNGGVAGARGPACEPVGPRAWAVRIPPSRRPASVWVCADAGPSRQGQRPWRESMSAICRRTFAPATSKTSFSSMAESWTST